MNMKKIFYCIAIFLCASTTHIARAERLDELINLLNDVHRASYDDLVDTLKSCNNTPLLRRIQESYAEELYTLQTSPTTPSSPHYDDAYKIGLIKAHLKKLDYNYTLSFHTKADIQSDTTVKLLLLQDLYDHTTRHLKNPLLEQYHPLLHSHYTWLTQELQRLISIKHTLPFSAID
jgi:hypothetical protein